MSTRDVPARIGDPPPSGRPATSAFLAAGITTPGRVAAHRRRGPLAMHGVGPKALTIFCASSAEYGLTGADGDVAAPGEL